MVNLYKRYNLGKQPSLEQIEPIAIRLLKNPSTLDDAIRLVLGRDLDPNKPDEMKALRQLAFESNGEKRFTQLLIIKTLDKQAAKK